MTVIAAQPSTSWTRLIGGECNGHHCPQGPENPQGPDRKRAIRVIALALAVIVLSGVDLYLTLSHMCGAGMFEGNPIAVWLADTTGSWIGPAVLKFASVAFAVSILLALRRRKAAELGAWIAVLVLAAVTVQWVRYSDAISQIDPAALSLGEHQAGFVHFD